MATHNVSYRLNSRDLAYNAEDLIVVKVVEIRLKVVENRLNGQEVFRIG
jgi:hypothetical protein